MSALCQKQTSVTATLRGTAPSPADDQSNIGRQSFVVY